MADPKNAPPDDLNFELRKSINDSYAYVKGQESVQAFSALTFEDLLDQQIERLSGAGTSLRPNAIDRITRLEQSIVKTVEKIKTLPPNYFTPQDEDKHVNTEV